MLTSKQSLASGFWLTATCTVYAWMLRQLSLVTSVRGLLGHLGILQADEVQKTVLQQQICTWTLLSVLYTAIEDAPVFNLPDKPSLPEMLRRECLSHWLKVGSSCLLVDFISGHACEFWF